MVTTANRMAESILFCDTTAVLTLAGPPGARAGAAMSELGALRDTSVLVEDGRIAAIGATATLAARAPAAVRIDGRGRTLLPSFVDSHTHLVWGGDRKHELELRLAGADYEQILAAGGGILASVRQTREASDAQLLADTLARVHRMQRTGTTSFEIKSGYGLDRDCELRQLAVARALRERHGVRLRTTCLAAHAIPDEFRGDDTRRRAYVDHVREVILPAVSAAGLADYVDVFCDRGAFTPDETRSIAEAGQRLGLGLRLHANELGHTGGARVAAELAAVSADHLLYLDDDDRRRLRDAGVIATLLPGTSMVLGKSFADGRALVAAGVAIAVATDCNPGSCALENLALVLALACYGCRLSPAEAIVAVTHNAAVSLGFDAEIGRIEPGMSADLILLATPDYRDLVYHAGSPLVEQVYCRGRRVDLD